MPKIVEKKREVRSQPKPATPQPIQERIQIYVDGPTLQEMESFDPKVVKGYTFNPTLFRNLGVTDYLAYAQKVISASRGLPLSLEVFADDEKGMIRQARILGNLAPNVYIKIPITTTSAVTTLPVMKTLVSEGYKLNITAVFTKEQVVPILSTLKNSGAIISVFSGRLFDIGVDAVRATQDIAQITHARSNCLVLWASPRMVYDALSAWKAGCDIITMQAGLIKKLSLFSKTPEEYSLETVKMFYKDAQESKYQL
ncbi:MAG: transaldolase [Elusimicrobia bacterium]|nr:transaldolase [Elusimicrobiota bacterium]